MIQNSEYIETNFKHMGQDISIDTIAKGILDDENNEGEDIFIPE